jgi:Phosphate-selective porin O and P
MQKSIVTLAAVLMAGLSATAHATNWLKLQGTEPAGSTDRYNLWGFIQPQYSYTENSKLPAGPYAGQKAVFNQIGPDLKSSSTFQIQRARIGVRGANFPLDSKTNYFLLLEAGRNGITKYGDSAVAATDASITLNHVPHARLRIGQFKYPGEEEGLQAIHVFNYINFTAVTDQLLLERFFDGDGSDTQTANEPNGSVGAFRDIGVQVFDWFNWLGMEHTYAAMVGNGNGIDRTDNNNKKDYYLYWASEKVFDNSTGARREGWKLFGWYENGERTLEYVNGVANTKDFDRKRWGFGTTYRKGKMRGAAEYVNADGMVLNGTDGGAVPGSRNNANTQTASFNISPDGKADGWYLDAGYKVLPQLELDLRYDYLDRVKNISADEREYRNWTIGAQWFFNKKTRMLVNYELRDAKAPNAPSSAVPNQILDKTDNRLTLQLLAIF